MYVCPDCGPHLKKEECAFLPWALEIIVQVPSKNLSSSSNGSPPSWWDIPDMNTSAYVAYKATHAHSRINHWLISVPGVGVDWDRLALWFVSCARSSHTCHYSHGHQNVFMPLGVYLPQAWSNVRTKFCFTMRALQWRGPTTTWQRKHLPLQLASSRGSMGRSFVMRALASLCVSRLSGLAACRRNFWCQRHQFGVNNYT